MAENEDEVSPEQPDLGKGGLTGWLTGGTAFIKALAGLIGACGVLVGVLAGAGVLGDDDSNGTTTVPVGFSEPPGLFQEVRRPHGRAFFEDDAMVLTALKPARPFVHLADIEEQHDVAITVSAGWLSGSRDFGVGVLCRYQGAGTYYLLAVLSGGRYNVMRYQGGKGRSLTGGIQRSPAIRSDANEIEARCVGDQTTIVTLVVNGRRVARAKDDDALESGSIGLRVGSGEARVTCRFERFVLRSL
jgi:hypothetical protein